MRSLDRVVEGAIGLFCPDVEMVTTQTFQGYKELPKEMGRYAGMLGVIYECNGCKRPHVYGVETIVAKKGGSA